MLSEREKSSLFTPPGCSWRAPVEPTIPSAEKFRRAGFDTILSAHGKATLRHRRRPEVAEEVEVCAFGRGDGSGHGYGFRLGDGWHLIAQVGSGAADPARAAELAAAHAAASAAGIARDGWEGVTSPGYAESGYYLEATKPESEERVP